MDQSTEYWEEVADAIAGYGPDDPVELWMLHEAIDLRDRSKVLIGAVATATKLLEAEREESWTQLDVGRLTSHDGGRRISG